MLRNTLSAALLGFLLPVIGIMGFNAWQDPFHYYRQVEDARFSTNARWQNPGMIRNYDYDSVLIGTSRFENFKPSMFRPAGWKVLKVTASGSMANEQLDTLSLVLSQGKADRIVLEMSHVSYTAASQRNPSEFPSFLYQSTLETPFKYLLSYDLLSQSIFGSKRDETPLDELYVWWPKFESQFGKVQLLRHIADRCRNPLESRGKRPPTQKYLNRLEHLIATHPQVTFIGVFTPLSAIALGESPKRDPAHDPIADRLNFRSQTAAIATRNSNMILYDYATRAEIVTDLERYKDTGHFDMATTELMAMEIVTQTAPLVDLNSVNAGLLKLREDFDAARFSCAQLTKDWPHLPKHPEARLVGSHSGEGID